MSAELIVQPESGSIDIKDSLFKFKEHATSIAVTDEMSFNRATAMARKAKDWLKIIEEYRKKANAPDMTRVKARNDKAKELSKPLEEVENWVYEKVLGYQAKLEEQKRQEAARIEAYSKLMDEDVPYVPPAEKTLRGDGMIFYAKNEKKFKVVDLAKVPLKYLQLNEDAVKADIKLGVNEIDGLEIYQTTTTQMRSR